MIGLAELQSYLDERARRHAVRTERATEETEKLQHRARCLEAIEIGIYVGNKIKEEQS